MDVYTSPAPALVWVLRTQTVLHAHSGSTELTEQSSLQGFQMLLKFVGGFSSHFHVDKHTLHTRQGNPNIGSPKVTTSVGL